jgi:4-aminobutyrate aminotransferase/(S)-3-amino-2-methylpropionate transaminase
MLDNPTRTAAMLAERDRHVPRGILTAHPVVLERGLGAEVWDVDGQRYLDFVGGIGVLNVGHNHPRVVAAVREQLERITHAAFQVAAYPPYLLGTTLTGMSAPYRQNFGPFAPEVFHVSFPNPYRGCSTEDSLAALEELFATAIAPDRVAAIIVEPVQGDGGFLPAPGPFLRALREVATAHGIVLVLDEIQSGFGRTGTMFAFEHARIRPDLVTVAKSLAGGLPLSGVVGRARIMDAPLPGGLGGTYGGNALACAAALAVLDAFEEDGLLERGRALGCALQAGLERLRQRFPRIGEVRAAGFMCAIEVVADPVTREPDAVLAQRIIDAAREGGLLVIKCGVHRNVVRFLAPLVTTDAQLAEALAILEDALERTAD